MTIKNLYPKSRPQTIYNVINGRPELPAASTFSRASEATYVDSGGIVQTAAAGEARFNYDPETREFEGLLLEKASTNETDASEDGGWRNANFTTVNPVWGFNCEKVEYKSNSDAPHKKISWNESPNGKSVTCSIFIDASQSDLYDRLTMPIMYLGGSDYPYVNIQIYDNPSGIRECRIDPDKESSSGNSSIYQDLKYGLIKYSGSIYRLWMSCKFNGTNSVGRNYMFVAEGRGLAVFGAQAELHTRYPTSYMPGFNGVNDSKGSRADDEFSLTSSNNFDGGFSLLLDSETTTEDFLYRIKAGPDGDKKIIASLNNDNGTLDWNVNGTSAANSTPPLYPQVGFVDGRVRTVSSFGAANSGIQNNYLYTTGISFPTPAVVASGANELEFGTPQTLKAVYVWNGQLASTEAISVIKGNPDSDVNQIPVVGDPYSFVYNTDPTTVGETSISLKYIVPVRSMRIYWGDGTTDRLEKAANGVLPLPQHTYPYPGQYRIQIVADDLFDRVRLGDITDTITRVDQWAPQHRVGAAGGGFTGSGISSLLYQQGTCVEIPPFEYTDLTNVSSAFAYTRSLANNDWDWVPFNLPKATTLANTFVRTTSNNRGTDAQQASFPQLQTSNELTNVNSCFYSCAGITGFKKDGVAVDAGISNTTKVTDFSYCFAFSSIKSGFDSYSYASAVNLKGTFISVASTTFPALSFPVADSMYQCFKDMQSLDSMPKHTSTSTLRSLSSTFYNNKASTIGGFTNTSNVENWYATFYNTVNMTQLYSGIDLSAATNMESFLQGSSVTSLPSNLSLTNVTTLKLAFRGLPITSFPEYDTPELSNVYEAWRDCVSLVNFDPPKNISKVTSLTRTFYNCQKLSAIPDWNDVYSNCTSFSSSFFGCTDVTAVPANIDVSKGTNFYQCWNRCSKLTTFPPNKFDSCPTFVDTAFEIAFTACALNRNSIENILVSLDTNGQSNIELGIDGGANADYKDWTAAAKTAYQNLIDKDWDIELNDSTGIAPSTLSATSGFYVNSQDGVVSFGELTPGSRHASGKANQEVIDDEGKAIDRVLELDESFFPTWDREETYQIGDRVKFGDYVYRALQENDARSFELPDDLEFNPDAEVATPANRQARWVEVYDPNYDEEMMMGLPE